MMNTPVSLVKKPDITLKLDAPFRGGFDGLLFFRLVDARFSLATYRLST